MNKILKTLMRFLITICIMTGIVLGTNEILKFKHRHKIDKDDNLNWSWKDENDNYYSLLEEKYEREDDSKNKMLVRMKNLEVPKKEAGEKRILVVGDSYVYGTGATNVNYTWWRQLDWRIKEEGYSNINIYSAGKYYLNTKEQLEMILENDELIKNVDPDLIIMGYVPNDPEEHDETGLSVKAEWDLIPEQNPIYKENPALYYEFLDRMHSLSTSEYKKLIEIGDKLGAYRWDARLLYILDGERLDRYVEVLKDVDIRMKELDIPYFYAFTNNLDNELVEQANDIICRELKKLSIDYFYPIYDHSKLMKTIKSDNNFIIDINPADNHPGIIWTYDYSKKIVKELKENYSFIFDETIKGDIDKIELNINDTMPFLKVIKNKKNTFTFEYPEKEIEKKYGSKFLYYPIEKDYVKLNLEYPKDIKKIKITGDNLENVEVYVNTINEEYDYDIDEASQKNTRCKRIIGNTFEVNKKITSVNIYAEFKDEKDRTLRIKFIE